MHKIIILLTLLLFSACSSKSDTYPSKQPLWINSPQKKGNIGAVGSAMPHFKGKASQRKLAISRALDELAQQQGVDIKNSIIRQEGRSNQQTHSSSEIYSIQNSSHKEIKAHIEAIWVDPRTQEVYIWLLSD